MAPEIPGAAPWLGISAALGIFSIVLPLSFAFTPGKRYGRARAPRLKSARSVLVTWSTPGVYEVIGAEAAPWLSGILRSLNFLKMEDNHCAETPLSDFKQEYRRDRVAHQIEYFSRQARKAERQERRYAMLGKVCGARGHAHRRRLSLRRAAMACQSRFYRPAMAGLHHVGVV